MTATEARLCEERGVGATPTMCQKGVSNAFKVLGIPYCNSLRIAPLALRTPLWLHTHPPSPSRLNNPYFCEN